MEHRKGILSVLLGLGILAISLALSTPNTALSQGAPGGKDVRVVNSTAEAVPVQLQPGATVGISGTPTVAIAGTSPVTVQNAPASPLYVNVVKSPARKPWQLQVDLNMADGEFSKVVSLPDPPAGKRYVIEFGSAQLLVLTTQIPYVQLATLATGNDPEVFHYFAVSNIGSYAPAQNNWSGTHLLKITATQGYVRALRPGGSNGPFFGSMSLTGYVEDNE